MCSTVEYVKLEKGINCEKQTVKFSSIMGLAESEKRGKLSCCVRSSRKLMRGDNQSLANESKGAFLWGDPSSDQ